MTSFVRSTIACLAFLFVFGCSKKKEEPNAAAEDWIPAEFKKGEGRWKDTGVYVDGTPVGVLSFGELPVELPPVWVEDEVSVPVKPGEKSPGYKLVKQRHYRFVDYFKAVGIDLQKV